MGMTITEKILARAAGRKTVSPGEIIEKVNIDMVMLHEGFSRLLYDQFRDLGVKFWDLDRVVVMIDHEANPRSQARQEDIVKTKNFAHEFEVTNWYYSEGIAHQVMPEMGHVRPGEVIVGTDSHTCTYGAFGAFSSGIGATEAGWIFATGDMWFRIPESMKFNVTGKLPEMVMAKDLIHHVLGKIGGDGAVYKAMEWTGSVIDDMSIDGRMVLANMAIEGGAKNGIIAPDNKTIEYVKSRTDKPFKPVYSDPDAEYSDILEIDGSELEPLVAIQPSPANVKSVSELEGTKIDRAAIGTCTGGRIEDLRIAAKIIKGRKIKDSDVKLLVIPASLEQSRKALEEGLYKIFIDAKAYVNSPSCESCQSLNLIEDEVAITTNNRNFLTRAGHLKSMQYLASPATVAASYVQGEITDPRKFL